MAGAGLTSPNKSKDSDEPIKKTEKPIKSEQKAVKYDSLGMPWTDSSSKDIKDSKVNKDSKDTGKKGVLSLLVSDALRMNRHQFGLGEYDDSTTNKVSPTVQNIGRTAASMIDKDNVNDTNAEKRGVNIRLGAGDVWKDSPA